MICIIAMVVFGVLGIFSATHRKYAFEAFDCVFHRVTLRPCQTGFDQKMRGKIVGKLFLRSPKAAKAVNKHFEIISWFFTILMFASFAYSAYSIYNLAVLGTCNPEDPVNCVFNPQDLNTAMCPFDDVSVAEGVGTIGNFAKVESYESEPLVYFLGTSWCPHCAWEKPVFNKVAAQFPSLDIRVVILDESPSDEDLEVMNHYSPEGSIPVVVIGGRYFRVGSGESIGENADELAMTALFCDISPEKPEVCDDPEVAALITQI